MVSSDKPIKDLENDLLDLNNSANILSKLILSSETPLTIGIHGKWGSGKTSLINLAEKTLSKNENIKIIKFNAWKYKGESLRRSFLLNVISELGDEKDEEIRTKLYNSIEEEKLGKIEINWIEIAKETTKSG
ncbi:MAG: hypothetical protein KAV48_00365, partial [Methanomicrobia archaeon]|nr:hypothetical protein [Methanomicrobia archaeon]